jgi:hypothetical protein
MATTMRDLVIRMKLSKTPRSTRNKAVSSTTQKQSHAVLQKKSKDFRRLTASLEKVMCIPSTSVPCERLFSHFGNQVINENTCDCYKKFNEIFSFLSLDLESEESNGSKHFGRHHDYL